MTDGTGTWTPPEPPLCFVRFMDLVKENGEHHPFVLDGKVCFYRQWTFGPDGWRVELENRYGGLFSIAGDRLAGHYFGVERL